MKNILIIDDDLDIGNVLEEILKNEGILFPVHTQERKLYLCFLSQGQTLFYLI